MSTPGPALPAVDPGAILAQILVEQGKTSTQLAVISEQLKAVPDHENRLRALETSHNKLAGAAATSKIWATVISATVTAAGSWIGFLVTHH